MTKWILSTLLVGLAFRLPGQPLLSLSLVETNAVLTVTNTTPGRSYIIEVSPDLGATWKRSAPIEATGFSLTFTQAVTVPARFYRVVEL